MEMNLAIDMPDIGRFRVNIHRQRGNPALAIRFITSRIPSLEQLNLPQVLHDLSLLPRRLVLPCRRVADQQVGRDATE